MLVQSNPKMTKVRSSNVHRVNWLFTPRCKKLAKATQQQQGSRPGGAKASPKKSEEKGASLPRGPKSAKQRAASAAGGGLLRPDGAPGDAKWVNGVQLTHSASQSARTAGYDIKRKVNIAVQRTIFPLKSNQKNP